MVVERNILPDGRILAWNRYGTGRRVVVHCHGSHHSGVEAGFLDAATLAKWTVLAPDRPGHGQSDPCPGQSLLEWARDVWVVLRRHGIRRPFVTGWSAGGPHALALAATGNVAGIGLLSSLAPMDRSDAYRGMRPSSRFGAAFARRLPGTALRLAHGVTPLFRRTPALIMALSTSMQPRTDRRSLQGRTRAVALAASRGAYRQGGAGVAHDVHRFLGSWGFDVADLDVPMLCWVGSRDRITPPAMSEYIAARAPRGSLRIVQGAGHFLAYGHLDAMLTALPLVARGSGSVPAESNLLRAITGGVSGVARRSQKGKKKGDGRGAGPRLDSA